MDIADAEARTSAALRARLDEAYAEVLRLARERDDAVAEVRRLSTPVADPFSSRLEALEAAQARTAAILRRAAEALRSLG